MTSPPTAWDIYKGALYGLHYGHALWEPSPIYSYQRVKPGYVGYIRDGGFHLLFDAGSGEPNDSLPQNFERLEVGPIKRRTRPPGCLHTATIKQIGVGGVDPLSVVGPVEPGANMNFELTSKQGAALITDHMTYREDIERKARTESYTKKHFDSWVDFAREQEHGDDVKPILVTGVDLTKKFASIAYADVKGSMRCNFSVGAPGSAAMTAWGTWHADGLVHNNCGQSLVTQGNQSRGEGSSSQLVAGADHDQCVFIRYITIRKRFLIPMVLRAGAGAHLLPEGNGRDGDAEAMIIETSDDLAEVCPLSASSTETHDTPPHNRDGFDVVAAFIFQRTDAKSVFFHDDDIEDLIRGSEEETIRFLEESTIIERVEIDEDGVAQLLPVTRPDEKKVSNPFPDDVSARVGSDLWDDTGPIKRPKEKAQIQIEPGRIENYYPTRAIGGSHDVADHHYQQGHGVGYHVGIISVPHHPGQSLARDNPQDVVDTHGAHEPGFYPHGSASTNQIHNSGRRQVVVPQRPYRWSYFGQFVPEDPITFPQYNGMDGIPLIDAMNQKFDNLIGRDNAAFPSSVNSVITLRLEWPGYESFCKQILTTDYTLRRNLIPKSRFAYQVAKEVRDFIEANSSQPVAPGTERWQVGPGFIEVQDLVLVRMIQVSRGSWQPEIRVFE